MVWGLEGIIVRIGPWGNNTIKRLWGEYKMFNQMITLEVAYRSRDTEYWTSDKSGTFFGDGMVYSPMLAGSAFRFLANHHAFYSGVANNFFTFTSVDQHNYLLGNVSIEGINFGLFIPNLFKDGNNTVGGRDMTSGTLVDDALKQSVFGASFNMMPIQFAAQFKFEDYGVYFGGRFFAGPLTAGLSFMGILNPGEESSADKRYKIGGRLDYNAGAFGAGLMASLDRAHIDYGGAAGEGTAQIIAIQPSFFYNVIPSHLGFVLDTGFYFTNMKDQNGETINSQPDLIWSVQPALFWNFRGTGAVRGYSWGSAGNSMTGMLIRYRMLSTDVNETFGANFLDVVFNWAF
jgi:hypothetical protein